MQSMSVWLPLLVLGTALVYTDARRVSVRPASQEQEEETVQYYAAAEPDDERQIVLVSAADRYNGLYGQQASSRNSQDNYIPSSRASLAAAKAQAVSAQRVKEQPKTPPVQTIRNYNKVNDDGSFTFGYEAADGSFKEETRGTDCVVRGKYGYVDPDGNKREFTYVSGNPCDPNAPKEESIEESAERESDEPENVPANYPTRPIRPLARPTAAPKQSVTFFQNNYQQEEEEQPEPEQVLRSQPVQTIRTRPYITRPQYESDSEEVQLYSRPTYLPSTTPSSVLYKQSITPINITPRPVASSTARAELPATTYRPQLLQVAVTPRPSTLYTKQYSATPTGRVSPSTASPLGSRGENIDFEREFQKFQQESNVISSTPSSIVKTTPAPRITKPAPVQSSAAPAQQASNGQIYSSALVYDPSTGQYNTQLYQTLPQSTGQLQLNQRIQPYVAQQQPSRTVYAVPQSSLYRPQASPQALYQQQQAELQFQNSAQLYAQQQRARSQQQQPSSPQSFYYVQPSSVQQSQGLSAGQIDEFLRGHNIQF